MKNLKLFEQHSEKWSLTKMEELYDDMNNMSELICEYLFFNKFVVRKEKYYTYHLAEFWFDAEEEDFFAVMYKKLSATGNRNNQNDFDYHFTKQQYEDLLIFMNDPKMYKDSKKYNL